MHHLPPLAAFPVSILLSGMAYADAEEWRVGVAGSGVMTTTSAGAVEIRGIGVGGRVHLGYGLSDPIEAAVFFGYSRNQALKFIDAPAGNQRGTLYADLDLASAGAELRVELGVETWRLFERIHPFVALRAAVLIRRLSGQTLLNESAMILGEPDDALDVAAAWGGAAGLSYRFGDHLFLAAVVELLTSRDTSEKALGLEVAWAWY